MRKNKIFVSFLLIAALSINCNDKTTDTKSINERLHGSWTWVKSTGGFGGTILKPSGEQDNKTISFDKTGKFKVQIIGQPTLIMDFSISQRAGLNSENEWLIKYSHPGLENPSG